MDKVIDAAVSGSELELLAEAQVLTLLATAGGTPMPEGEILERIDPG